jgi:O-acetylserine/cysteine efflux transporter
MARMSRRDTALACLVAVLWGANFVAIHESLAVFPPFFLAFLRFALLAVPALLLVPRPQVRVRWLVLYGVGFGILQFVFLYAGMAAGVPAGLASLLLQASAPFTVLLAAAFLHERPGGVRLAGIAVAVAGFTLIAVTRGLQAQLVPVLLVLAGALGWAVGNIGAREARTTQPFAFMMWMTVIPPIPLLLLSLVVEGPADISSALSASFTASAWPAWAGLAYTVLLSTVVGTSLWAMLMGRNPSSSVAPFSMLVPVAGFLSAGLLLGERPDVGDLVGGVLVILGVLLPTLVAVRRHVAARGAPVDDGVPPPSPVETVG